MTTNKFVRIKCPRCNNTQVTYGRASTWVKCKNCNKLLSRPKGGKAKIRAFIKHVFN